MTKLMLTRLSRRFSGQFGPEKGALGPKIENFQKMKKTPQIFTQEINVTNFS